MWILVLFFVIFFHIRTSAPSEAADLDCRSSDIPTKLGPEPDLICLIVIVSYYLEAVCGTDS